MSRCALQVAGSTVVGGALLTDSETVQFGHKLALIRSGSGSVVESAISPVIKVCANPETYARMRDDMDVDAGRILSGEATLDEVAADIVALVQSVAAGDSNSLGGLGPLRVHLDI